MTTSVVCDLGAGSGRVMLADHDGARLELREVHRFHGYAVERGDGPHWDIQRVFAEIVAGLRLAHGIAGRIDSIGLDGWGLDYALVDAEGMVAGDPFHYRHPRCQRGFAAAAVPPAAMFAATGSQILPINTAYQLADEARTAPEWHRGGARLLMIADAVCHHLTGVARAELSLARTTGLVDAASEDWSDALCARLGIERRLLPPIVRAGQVVGHLREEIGLGPVPVIAVCAHDTASAVAALPLTRETGFLILGSWSLVGAETGAVDLRPETLAAGFGTEGGIAGHPFLVRSLNGLHLIQKLRDSLRRRGSDLGFAEIARLAAAAPVRGAIDPAAPAFQNPADVVEAIAAACGPEVAADPGATARAIYAGLAGEAARAIVALESLLGRRLEALRLCGGGAQDALLCDMIAEATGKTLVVGPIEASAWGNAIVQLIGLGEVASLAEGRALVERSTPRRVVAPGVADACR